MADETHRTTTDLPADPAVVWEVLTSPEGVEDWLGAGSELPPVEGADLDVADVETGIRRHGRVTEVVPGRRLGYVWWPADRPDDDGADASRVAIDLLPHEGGTTLVITESRSSGPAPTATACVAGAWGWRAAAIEISLMARRRVTAA